MYCFLILVYNASITAFFFFVLMLSPSYPVLREKYLSYYLQLKDILPLADFCWSGQMWNYFIKILYE